VSASDANGGAAITTNVTGVVVTYGASAPDAPGIPNAVASDEAVILSWTAPNPNGAPITSYLIRASHNGSVVGTGNSSSTTYTFDQLRNGWAYTFTVAAVNSAGTGSASAPSASVTPTAGVSSADMSAAVSGFPASAAPGTPVTGTATCTNVGDTATNATCAVTGAVTLSCPSAPTLENGATISCPVSYTMPASGPGTVTVTAHSDTSDPDQTNNTASATTNPPSADMRAAVSGFPASAPANTPVSGTATCTNGGPATATNATCAVTGATPASCTPAPTLASGAAISCTVSYTMPLIGSGAVTVTAHSDTSDPTLANDTATATTTVQ
jgi:hypothetical protein